MGSEESSETHAVLVLAKDIARRIVRGEVSHLDGAEAIRRLQLRIDEHIEALEPFRHASFEANPHETDQELKKWYEDMVMEAAKHLLSLDS